MTAQPPTTTPEAVELPTGTVTFLMTDVEGSTQLLHGHPTTYPHALLRHHALLRDAVERNRGQVVETEGDAILAAFSRPSDGVAAALDAQLAFSAEDWGELGGMAVRIGVHTGEVELYGRQYIGMTLHRAARLTNAGHGGQILLSEATAAQVRDGLPAGAALKDLGEHGLKDLAAPTRILQLMHADLRTEFPPLRALDARRHNLPAQGTPFVGRERLLEAIRALLVDPEVRLLTLTGTGGTGKTRLALHVAAEALEVFEHGVWFVPLAPVSDPALVLPTAAQELHVRESAGRSLAESLKAFLGARSLLLVLDNFEQVLPAAPAVAELLAACPGLKVLITSREPLRVYGEHQYPVPPLELPAAGDAATPERLTQCEAVRLFVQQARAIQPDFTLTGDSGRAVAEICRRLDGLPLAIELAAARTKLLPPAALLSRLGRRLPLLSYGPRDLPARQQTLRGAISWSHELLSDSEREVFARFAAFAGGAPLEIAEQVCGAGEAIDGVARGMDVLDCLASLVDKNLLKQEVVASGESRLSMLETIREYATERLEESGRGEATRRTHAEAFLALAERAEPLLHGPEQVAWLDRLEREHDNFRAVLTWATSVGEHALALRLAGAVGHFWFMHAHYSEGRAWLRRLLAAAPARTVARAKALHATALVSSDDYATSRSALEESLAIRREIGDRPGVAYALHNLADAHREGGDFAAAYRCFDESLAIWRELGFAWGIASSPMHRGLTAYYEGDFARARALYEDALAKKRALGEPQGVAYCLLLLGLLDVEEGDHQGAAFHAAESAELLRQIGDRWALMGVVSTLAGSAAAQGDAARAVRLAGAVVAAGEEIGGMTLPGLEQRFQRLLMPVFAQLGERAAEVMVEGRGLTLEQAVADGLEPFAAR